MKTPNSKPLLPTNEENCFAAIEGIQQGLDDFELGRFSSFEDFIAEQNEKHGLTLEA
jgi:hypothetical protein